MNDEEYLKNNKFSNHKTLNIKQNVSVSSQSPEDENVKDEDNSGISLVVQ